ncbi:MAG: L-threonylcarbamoyladenylate synthase [Planctomycetales bacterium]
MAAEIGSDVSHAAGILRAGGLVAIPTETVYGLAGNALNVEAVAKIFEAKQRPEFDPLIVHVPSQEAVTRYVADFPPTARCLAEKFWPGPLTLVLPRRDVIPDLVTSGLPGVGIRIPQHPVTLELLRQIDFPLAAPSANLFGRLSPTTAQHVADQLAERVDYILDGGACRVGVESTVLELVAVPRLLRPGGVPLEEIQKLIGPVEIAASTDDPGNRAQVAPGMLPQHYAPRTPLRIVPHSAPPGRIGYLAFQKRPAGEFASVEVLSPTGNLREAAANFFAALRRLDEAKLDLILAEAFPEQDLGRALNDRLRRGAVGTGHA